MDQPTAQDIFNRFDAIQSVVLNYGDILRSRKAPSVVYEENRTELRTRFADAMALFQAAQTELQHLSQEELMVQLGGQIRDLDNDFKDHCVTYNRNWEMGLKEIMDELRSHLAPLLYLPITGVEAGTQTEQRTHDSEAGTQTEERENDSGVVEEIAAVNASNDPQPDGTQTEQRENDIETVERTAAGNALNHPQPDGAPTEETENDNEIGIQIEPRANDSDTVGDIAAGNESNDPHPDQHETTMDESVEGNPPDNPVPEPSPLAEIEVEQGLTFDDAEDDMEANVADHDTNHTAEDVTVNRGDTRNPEEDLDETMRDAPAENDNESSSSDSSDSSDSDDEPIVSHPPSRQRVSSRNAGGSIEVLQTPVRQTRSAMARMSSPRATRSSKQKEPLQNKRRASNASPPPTRSKRLRGGTESAKKTDQNPQQARPTPRESSKPTESPAGGPSRNTTRELPQKRGNKSVESSTRAPRRRSQRYIVESGENGEFEGVLKPIPGKVYATYREKLKSFLAVIALPMGDFSSIGFEGSIDSCDLTENPCYTKNRKGEYTLVRGYRDGEELEKERIFPILYFDGNPFPHQSAIGWCAAKDLREFKDEHQLVPYMKTVRQYLRSRGFTEDMQDSEAERARSESVAPEIQVAGSDDDYTEPSEPDTDPEDLDAIDDAEEDVDMTDGMAEEPSNTRQRNQQEGADRREEDRPGNETPEHERPAEPAEIPATTSPSDEPFTEASAVDEPLVGKHVNFTHINEHVRDVPRTEQRETRPLIKEEEIVVILSDSEDEDATIPASNAEHHSTGRGPLSHVFPFETPEPASYPPIGTFHHASMAASPGQSAPPSQARQEPSQSRPQRPRSQVHQLLNTPQPSHPGRSEPVTSAQAQRQISNQQPSPSTRAVPSRRDTSRIRIYDILSPESSSEASGSGQHAQRERPSSTLQETAVQAAKESGGSRHRKACEECRRTKSRCDPSHWSSDPIPRSVTAIFASSQPAAQSGSGSAQHPLTPSTSPSVNPNHDHQLPRGTSSAATPNSSGNSADHKQASQSTLFEAWLQGDQTSQSPSSNSHLQRRPTSAVAPSQAGPSQDQNDQGRRNEDVYSRSNRDNDHPPPETFDEFIYQQRGHLPPEHICFQVAMPLVKPREFPRLTRSSKCPPGLTRYLRKLPQANGWQGHFVEDSFHMVDDKGVTGHWCPFCEACGCHRNESYLERQNFVAHLVTHWKRAGGMSPKGHSV